MFPTTALLLLVNATILYRLQDGPFWRHITEPIRVFARENGWRNLLMINNFSNKESVSSKLLEYYFETLDLRIFYFYLCFVERLSYLVFRYRLAIICILFNDNIDCIQVSNLTLNCNKINGDKNNI